MHDNRKNPYLIQRLERIRVEGSVSEKRFGEIFGLDYMGAAEYEFGAFANFLRAMHAATLKTFKVDIGGQEYFGVYDTAMYSDDSDVATVLHGIAEGKFRHKASPNFPPKSTYNAGDAWADIQNNLFWSKENISTSIIQCIANSVTFMDNRPKE